MKFLLAGAVALIACSSAAQNSCSCHQALTGLATTIERDYPGFEVKTTDRDSYQRLRDALLEQSRTAKDTGCTRVLDRYVALFHDHHIYLAPVEPPTPADASGTTTIEQQDLPEAHQLTPGTFYVRLPSFAYDQVEPIAELVRTHSVEIASSRNLIIDVRGNRGGTDDAYRPLLPYILTGPVRVMSVAFLSTPTLINGLRDYAVQQAPPGDTAALAAIERDLEPYKKDPYGYVLWGDAPIYLDSVPVAINAPARIVVLTDREVASAAENFVFSVRQSPKVKLLGTPTMGALDYGSLRAFDFGCDNYLLYLPTYRSARLPAYPIDNIGVQPDIYLDPTVPDWLAFALGYLGEPGR